MHTSSILILLIIPICARGLTGYDCNGEGLNITTLSLLDIGSCDLDNVEPANEEVYVQLMQLSDYNPISARQCRVEVDRTVYYCGMHSHVSIVNNGRRQYIRELGADACRRLHETGTLTISTATVDKLSANSTNWRSITLAGRTAADGNCWGAQYTDSYGTWDNVVVQATAKISLRTFEANTKQSTGEIILPSGARCAVNDRVCFDTDGSETYWEMTPPDSCHFDRYDILYEGLANKLSPAQGQTTPVVYTVTSRDTTFALTKSGETSVCGYKLFKTEHPKLLVLETQRGRTFKSRSRVSVKDLDMFAYVNSKFVYVEKHIKLQLTRLYKDLMEQKCALEQQVLRNVLSLSSIAPDEMAFRMMKMPGYTAVVSGEVIHLIKCVPVQCKIRHTEGCYNELPVTYRNGSYFLLPRSRILTRKGTSRDCHGLLPAMYKVQDTWFRITTRPEETIAPPIIQPLTQPSWKYVSPDSLATSGIYTAEDLDRLRDHIMFPVEKPSMLNTIARGAMGQDIPSGSISMLNLLDEESLDRIAESAGKRIWNGFMSFGSASAGVLAIFVVVRIIKLIIDTFIHGYALHSIYGWSMHLLGAIWSSVTNLLLHMCHKQREPASVGHKEYILLRQETRDGKIIFNRDATAPEQTEGQGEKSPTERSYSQLRKYLETENL